MYRVIANLNADKSVILVSLSQPSEKPCPIYLCWKILTNNAMNKSLKSYLNFPEN